MKELIQKLCEISGPSGYENNIREAIKKEVTPYADSIEVDPLGNLMVRKGKKTEGGLRILISAHMDEIGVIVTHVEKTGFVRFGNLGAAFPWYLPASRVLFLNGTRGVINSEPREDNTKVSTIDQSYIDVGASSPEDCPVKIGDVGVFERPFMDMGTRVASKAMDNRSSCAVLIETLRQLKKSPHELVFLFSVQEEVGIRGAVTASYAIDPDLGIAVDVTSVGDTPSAKQMEVGLGKGAAIKIRDSGMLCDPRVVRWMRETAEKASIPHQMEILRQGSTDAYVIQTSRSGVPTGAISIPCRYVHSPSEVVDVKDLESSVQLLLKLIGGPVQLK